MAAKKKIKEPVQEQTVWPKVTQGRHSTWIEHENGQVEYQPDWTLLGKEIEEAINMYNNGSEISLPKDKKTKKSRS